MRIARLGRLLLILSVLTCTSHGWAGFQPVPASASRRAERRAPSTPDLFVQNGRPVGVVGDSQAGAAREGLSLSAGDFNCSGSYDATDIDLMIDALGEEDLSYDLTGDMAVDGGDLTYLLVTLMGTRYGDLNLDRMVDLTDFGVLANHWRQSGRGWAQGNLNGRGETELRGRLGRLGCSGPTLEHG